MNKIRVSGLLVSLIIISTNFSPAQSNDLRTEEFKVKGVCKMCKERIENAAYIKGVKYCEWDKETEILKVVFKPNKVSLEEIHASIANAGHTTSMKKADPEAYEKLPDCCAYDSGVTKH